MLIGVEELNFTKDYSVVRCEARGNYIEKWLHRK